MMMQNEGREDVWITDEYRIQDVDTAPAKTTMDERKLTNRNSGVP